MSLDSITGDEFMSLAPEDHRVALDMYETATHTITHNLGNGVYDAKAREEALDRLTSLLTLRKLHKVRLAEMEDDEQPTRALASERYQANELIPVS